MANTEIENPTLAEDIQKIEALIKSGVDPAKEFLLKGYLLNAKSQLAKNTFDARHEESKKEDKVREATAISYLADREIKLNAEEKGQYSEFLAKDYFQKPDFHELDNFYAHTWDKLSEEGKSEMSYRVWEGIRRDEYEFDELPESIRKGESERLYQQFTDKDTDAGLENIPERDRDDFIRAHNTGNQEAVKSVLSREVFSVNVSSQSESSKLEDSRTKVNKSNSPDARDVQVDTNPLAKLSAVQETNEVLVPQLGAGASSSISRGKGG